MSDSSLKYSSDLAALIRQLRNRGWSDEQIVQRIMRGYTAAEVREYAKKWAPILGITPAEFIRMAGLRSMPR